MNGHDKQKVVLVTGGSAGIGKATAIEFAKLGYKIAITGRNQEKLSKVIEALVENSISKSPDDFLALQADFEIPAQVEPIVESTIAKFGRLDILINNAGYAGKGKAFTEAEFFEDFKNIMQVNLIAATRIAQLASPYLVETTGILINVSSIADRIGFKFASYCISKAGMSMMTKTVANALDGTGVRVLTVAPGPVVTNFAPEDQMRRLGPMTHLGRVGESSEVADTILFLCSDKASFINACSVDIDGGACTKGGGPQVYEQLK